MNRGNTTQNLPIPQKLRVDMKVDLESPDFILLVKQKLAIPGSRLIEFDNDKITFLKNRVKTELQPTLSQRSSFEFDLESVIEELQHFSGKLA